MLQENVLLETTESGELQLQNMTIGDCLRERVRRTPEGIAVEFEGQKLTWKELDTLSDWLVYRFHFFGMKKGSRAALWCGNHMQWVIVYFGLQKIGATAILINPGYQVDELYNVLSYAQIEYLFYGETFKELNLPEVIGKIDLREHPYLKQTIPIEMQDAIDFMLHGAASLTSSERETVEQLKTQVQPSDTACMMFTSGTTSVPKGVMLTHYSLVNDAMATVHAMGWTPEDKTCVMVPLFHCFGMTSCLLAGVISGCSMYLMKYYRTATALQAIQDAGCTVLNGVPSMFLAMVHNKAFDQFDIHTLKSGIIAGSPISPEEYGMICEKLRIRKLQMSYGQTETSPGITFSGPEETIEEKSDNAGYGIAHVDLCIWEKDGTQHIYPYEKVVHDGSHHDSERISAVEYGITGEIGVRGFLTMQEYYRKPEETKKTLEPDGWLHTGDVGFLDEKRRLHISGRIKEMIIRGGENISPVEIEECIKQIDGILDVKVIGVPQVVLQEEIAACVVSKKAMTEEQIREFAAEHLAYYKVPKYVFFFDELPVNASGKVKTGELKEIVLQRSNNR